MAATSHQVRPTCCAVRDLRGRALTWAELQETSVLVASHVQQLMEARLGASLVETKCAKLKFFCTGWVGTCQDSKVLRMKVFSCQTEPDLHWTRKRDASRG